MKNTMETQQQQSDNNIQDLGNKSSSSYACRQSSTRWTPTSDQIRILKELYYNNGIRSPTADQIQRIAAQLRQYGKIEGKNVFYWFQNHKARERQKKRFTPSAPPHLPPPPPSPFPDHINHHHHLPTAVQIPSHHHHHYHHQEPPTPPHVYTHQHKLYTTHHIGVGSSSQGVMPVGCGYGSVAMEKSFRECSISPPGESRATRGIGRNFGSRSRVDVDSYSFFDKIKPTTYEIIESNQDDEHEEEGETSAEIETLPLFPIHGGTHHDFFSMKAAADLSSDQGNNGGYYTGGSWYRSDGRASLELSLNSYGQYYN